MGAGGAAAVHPVAAPIAALIGAGFRRQARYRGAIAAGALTNSVFGLLRASIVSATIGSAGGQLGGYAAAAGVTYVWVGQALLAPLQIFFWDDLALRVRTGDIAVDLVRPVDLQLQYGAQDLGRALAVTLPRALPILAVGAVTFGLALPTDPWAYLAGLVSIGLGVGVSFACRYLMNLAAVWLLDIRGLLTVYFTLAMVLCGLVVPVHWFPAWLGALDAATPFPSMLQAPADIFTGRASGGAVVPLLGTQLAWLVGALALGQVVQRLGTRRLVVQGG
jgi:viologen exporter family transport system permease protein